MKIQLTLRIPEDYKVKLEQIAQKKGISLNALILSTLYQKIPQ